MTREEAKLWMQVLKHAQINWVGEQAEDEDLVARCEEAEQEAFDMAIEALSAEPKLIKVEYSPFRIKETSTPSQTSFRGTQRQRR